MIDDDEREATLAEVQRITETIRSEARSCYAVAMAEVGIAKWKVREIEKKVDQQLEKLDEATIRLIYGKG